MDLEFKSEQDCWDFCAKLHKKLRKAYESENEFVELNKTEQFRLVRVLELFHYPKKEKLTKPTQKGLIDLSDVAGQMFKLLGVRSSYTSKNNVLGTLFRDYKIGMAHSQVKWEYIHSELNNIRSILGNRCGLCYEFGDCSECPVGISTLGTCTDQYSDYDLIVKHFDNLMEKISKFGSDLNNLLVKEES